MFVEFTAFRTWAKQKGHLQNWEFDNIFYFTTTFVICKLSNVGELNFLQVQSRKESYTRQKMRQRQEDDSMTNLQGAEIEEKKLNRQNWYPYGNNKRRVN